MDRIQECLKRLGQLEYKLDEPLKKYTTFKIGGKADVMVFPKCIEQVQKVLFLCRELGIPWFIMGNGSNLLVRDKGIRGVVIKIAQDFAKYEFEGNILKAQAGARLILLSNAALAQGLMGLEFAGGIPGTLGGAIAMNAGAYGGEIKQVLRRVTVLDSSFNFRELEVKPEDLGYRYSRFTLPEYIVLKAELELQPDDGGAKERHAEFMAKRIEKQPLNYPSAGSAFKRPPGHYAGQLISEAGLKGKRIGDAEVSTLHAGFIINKGNATAEDVLKLIEEICQRVFENSGVMLETELKIVGEQ